MSYKATNWAYDVQIQGSPKPVLVALADMADEAGSCFPSQDRIAAMTGLSASTVRRAVGWLEGHGLLSREPRRGALGHRSSDRYYLNVGSVPAESQPVTAPTRQSAYLALCKSQPVTVTIPTGHSDRYIEEEPSLNHQIEPSALLPDSDETDRQQRFSTIPADWQPTTKHLAMAASLHMDAAAEQARFMAWHERNGSQLRNVNTAFTNWLKKGAVIQQQRAGSKPPPRRTFGQQKEDNQLALRQRYITEERRNAQVGTDGHAHLRPLDSGR